jgi:hypothetical protein
MPMNPGPTVSAGDFGQALRGGRETRAERAVPSLRRYLNRARPVLGMIQTTSFAGDMTQKKTNPDPAPFRSRNGDFEIFRFL